MLCPGFANLTPTPPLSPEPGLTFSHRARLLFAAVHCERFLSLFPPSSPPEVDATPQSDPQNSEAGEGKERVEKEEELYSQYFTF